MAVGHTERQVLELAKEVVDEAEKEEAMERMSPSGLQNWSTEDDAVASRVLEALNQVVPLARLGKRSQRSWEDGEIIEKAGRRRKGEGEFSSLACAGSKRGMRRETDELQIKRGRDMVEEDEKAEEVTETGKLDETEVERAEPAPELPSDTNSEPPASPLRKGMHRLVLGLVRTVQKFRAERDVALSENRQLKSENAHLHERVKALSETNALFEQRSRWAKERDLIRDIFADFDDEDGDEENRGGEDSDFVPRYGAAH